MLLDSLNRLKKKKKSVNAILLAHLTAVHQLLVSSSVLVGGSSILSGSDGLCGRGRSLLGSILGNMKIHINIRVTNMIQKVSLSLSASLSNNVLLKSASNTADLTHSCQPGPPVVLYRNI